MGDIWNVKTFDTLSIDYCTDNQKFLESDSHYLHIPHELFILYSTSLDFTNICFELSNINDSTKKIYLKKIEPSIVEYETKILIPDWICKKLSIDVLNDKINIKPITGLHIIKRCKIKGDNSSYLKMDIKTLLEKKIENLGCINLNSTLNILNVNFTFVELISTNDELIQFGILSDELEIDFDIPDDIKFIEKRKQIVDKITNKIDEKLNSIIDEKNKYTNNIKQKKKFKFSELIDEKKKIENFTDNAIDWDELNNFVKDTFDKNSPDYQENLIILQEVIEQGKINLKKIEEENKLNNNNKQNFIFNTTPYKLTDADSDDKNTPKLTREEIRKLRLEKLTFGK